MGVKTLVSVLLGFVASLYICLVFSRPMHFMLDVGRTCTGTHFCIGEGPEYRSFRDLRSVPEAGRA